MTDQPNPNPNDQKREIPHAPGSIIVYGNVGPGASIGSGSVTADQIAGNDLIINGTNIDNQGQRFADLLEDLKDLLVKAKDSGELPMEKAQEVIKELEAAKEMIEGQKKPPKDTLIQRLQRVVEVIDDVIDNLNESNHPAAVLLKALPFAALLIRLASQIF